MKKLFFYIFTFACLQPSFIFAHADSKIFVVKAQEVVWQNLNITRDLIGELTTESFSILHPGASGNINKILVKAGEQVIKGQLLIKLEAQEFEQAVSLWEGKIKILEKKIARSRRLRKSQDITQIELESKEQDLINAQVSLQNARQKLTNYQIKAPFDGIVGVARVVLGQFVSTTSELISLRREPFLLKLIISGSRLGEIKVGQRVDIIKKNIQAKINAVELSIDPKTRTGFARAIIPKCNQCIVGESVRARVLILQKNNVITVPNNAIFYSQKKPQVVIIKQDSKDKNKLIAHKLEVKLGVIKNSQTEIISGLKLGQKIVIENPQRLHDGSQVRIIE